MKQKTSQTAGLSWYLAQTFRRKSEVVFIFLVLAILFAAVSISTEYFLVRRNIINLFVSNIGLLFVTFAQLIILLLGGVNLSVGALISLTNVICVTIITEQVHTWILALILCTLCGLTVGLINGLLVAKAKLQPLIATLATSTVLGGIALLIMPNPSGALPSRLCKFFTGGANGLVPFLFVGIVSVFMWLLINRTRFGRSLLAIGGSVQAARSSGIQVENIQFKAYLLSSLLSVLSGLFLSAYATSGNPLIGDVFTQQSITAAVVGGASLSGGKGSVSGCIAAVLVLGVLYNMMNLMHISSYYQYVFQGLVLMISLSITAIRTRY